MIRLNKSNVSYDFEDPIALFSQEESDLFFCDLSNREYLRYNHIVRYNNHYQYYFRLSRLFHDKRKQIEKWLTEIKSNYFFPEKKTVSVLMAPQHFSNTGYVNSVNSVVFNGTAHIIEFDINREFRSNFKAKYNNYCELERLISQMDDYTINFYYINDQIVSGNAYQRTKSLINSLFEKANNIRLNIFRGIFVLFDRNSIDTRMNYISPVLSQKGKMFLPFFSFLKLDIPSLRNHDDSCPICYEKNKASEIIKECALDSTVEYWQKTILMNREKEISEIRQISEAQNTSDNDYKSFQKLQCENDLWIASKKAYNTISDAIDLIAFDKRIDYKTSIVSHEFYSAIKHRLETTDNTDIKAEYIISFMTFISNALLYYQEDIKRVAIYILLKAFSFFLASFEPDSLSVFFNDEFPIGDDMLEFNLNSVNKSRQYEMFKVIITRLCSIGSCVLLDYDRLLLCRNIGHFLCESLSLPHEAFDEFLLVELKRLLCYNKGNSKGLMLHEIMWNSQNNKLVNSDVFFTKLFLENTRRPIFTKNPDIASGILSLRDDSIYPKYKKLIQYLKDACKDITDDSIEIQICTPTINKESISEVISITEEEIKNLDGILNKDFSYDQQTSTYYIKISNNYNQLKNFVIDSFVCMPQVIERELNIIKDAGIIICIKTKTIGCVAQILQYRTEILELVIDDFNNDAFSKLIATKKLAIGLSETKAVNHQNKPLQRFEELFKKLLYSNIDLSTQRMFLSLYMDTVIAIAYREQLRKENKTQSISLTEQPMFTLGYNIVDNKLMYIEKQLEDEYNGDITLLIGEMYNGTFIDLTKKDNTFKAKLSQKYLIVRFRDSEEIAEPYMLVQTFIRNAFQHCENPKIEVLLIKNNTGGFDLHVKNTVPKQKLSLANKGITMQALKHIFQDLLIYPLYFDYNTCDTFEVVFIDFIISC